MTAGTGIAAGAIAAIIIGALIGWRLARRDVRWRRIRVGVYLERERFDDDKL